MWGCVHVISYVTVLSQAVLSDELLYPYHVMPVAMETGKGREGRGDGGKDSSNTSSAEYD